MSPRPYPQLLRGERHRWWRSLLSLSVVVGGLALLLVVSTIGLFVASIAGGVDLEGMQAELDEPWVLLSTNLLLAYCIPLSMLAVWAGHGWRPRWVASVAGGLRWRWMLACAVVSLVVAVAGTAFFWVLDGGPSGVGRDVAVLLLIVALTTPLQAAGEEYLFRGWMSQAVGALFARAAVGAVVAAAFSAGVFALAHGGQNAFLFVDRFAFGLLASYLVWRTGGLEAAIAAHTVNNVVVFVPVILTGGLAAAIGVSEASPGLVAFDVVSMVLLGAALTWLARRAGVQRLFVEPRGPDDGNGGTLLAPPTASGSIHPR